MDNEHIKISFRRLQAAQRKRCESDTRLRQHDQIEIEGRQGSEDESQERRKNGEAITFEGCELAVKIGVDKLEPAIRASKELAFAYRNGHVSLFIQGGVVWVWFGEHGIRVPQITNTLLVLCTS